jgi:hypothetical protein
VRSLLEPCRTIREVGYFVIVDVDVSGIPVDIEGLVRPGIPSIKVSDSSGTEFPSYPLWETTLDRQSEHSGTEEDATFHIEADWDGNPEAMLLCVRYKGRRLETINPATADISFLKCLMPLTDGLSDTESPGTPPSDIIEWTIPKLLSGCPLWQAMFPFAPSNHKDTNKNPMVLLSLPGRPRLRYFAAELYRNRNHIVRMASDSIGNAYQDGLKVAKRHENLRNPVLVVSGSEPGCSPTADDWLPSGIANLVEKHEVGLQGGRVEDQRLGDVDQIFTVGRTNPQTYLFVKNTEITK